MKIDDLRSYATEAQRAGLRWLQFSMRRDRSPGNWDRVRVMAGVYGRVIGETYPGVYLVDVALDDVLAVIKRYDGGPS